MQTINFNISPLLDKIRAGHFLLPQFQRDFTWKEAEQITPARVANSIRLQREAFEGVFLFAVGTI